MSEPKDRDLITEPFDSFDVREWYMKAPLVEAIATHNIGKT